MAGKFELFKDSAGKFRFRLKAANGEVIAISEAYTRSQRAERHQGGADKRPYCRGRRSDQSALHPGQAGCRWMVSRLL